MSPSIKASIFVFLCVSTSLGCSHLIEQEAPTQVQQIKSGPITIFIHGTVFPIISRTIHEHDTSRRGLHKFSLEETIQGHNRFIQALCESDPEQFQADSCYSFYWSGGLSISTRKDAAQELYEYIKDHEGPITLIGHSHGCSIALHLAECADNISINRLILLAAPVQRITSHLTQSKVFPRIYCCYSGTDIAQVVDLQVFHLFSIENITKPIFSERVYPEYGTITQARIMLDEHNPGHQDFIQQTCGKQLPHVLRLLDKVQKSGQSHAIISVPSSDDQPYFVPDVQRGLIEIMPSRKILLITLLSSIIIAWQIKEQWWAA